MATTLAPGDSTTCSADHTVTQAELDANGSPTAASGLLTNNASATGTPDLGDARRSHRHARHPHRAGPLDRRWSRRGTFNDANTNGEADPGETISYAFSVTNDGNVTLTNVTLADTVGGVTISGGPIATLAVGATDSHHLQRQLHHHPGRHRRGRVLQHRHRRPAPIPTVTDVSDPDDETVTLPQAPAIDAGQDRHLQRRER